MTLLGSGFDLGATNVFTDYQAKYHFDTVHYLDIIDSRVVFDDMIRLHGGEDDDV
jgi:saccharopine dehydrogenase-like NADP-dependent oxidoreductase